MRYAARVDDNQGEIVRALTRIGAYVIDCSHVGQGFPDLLIAYRGRWTLVEIKDGQKSPSRRKLTPAQTIFHAEVLAKGCKVHVIETVDEAIRLIGSIGTARAA
jgi:predicted RecB family nuclease